MFNETDARQLIGSDLRAAGDEKVGRIGQIFLDDQTGQPEWATVNTGFFGTNESFVPLEGAQRVSSGVTVPFTKDQIKDAPNVDPTDGHLEESQEAELYRHYNLTYSGTQTESDYAAGAPAADTTVGRHAEGQESLVRSEEELNVDKERVQTGKARLRKYVVTDQETVTVPVQKERVRLETEPLTDQDRARGAGDITEGETEVTLSEERVVVGKETVAKEKVGLVKEVEEQKETVSEDVRKEKIEVEGDVDRRR